VTGAGWTAVAKAPRAASYCKMMRGWVPATLLVVTAFGVGGAPSMADPGKAPTIRNVPLENREALAHFYGALDRLKAGQQHRVRVLHYGDSNVAADLWTKVTRRSLQERFGDGGAGYLVPGFGSRWNDRLTVRKGAGWKARRRGFARDFGPLDGLWGLAGVAAEGKGRGAWMDLTTRRLEGGGVLEVHALGKPNGGRLAVRIDGGEPQVIPTQSRTHELVERRWDLAPGEHSVRIHVNDQRPARLLGVVLENTSPGVVYDVLGINGHRASAMLDWNEPLIRAQLERRAPDLVVLSYGGNEALDPQLGMDTYARHLERVVTRVRSLAPHASLLLVGPIPMCPERPRVAKVAKVQRRIAERAAVAFWDTSRISDKGASLCSWRHRKPPLISGDGMHLSKQGYSIVGEKFTKALLGSPHR
jgi:lysophospholipase L1-like esterase